MTTRFFDVCLFFLLLSGPSRLRERDRDASLAGEIDLVVVFHLLVWAVAGLWVAREFLRARHLRLPFPARLGLALGGLMLFSALFSSSPLLTAFRSYQLGITVLFVHLFMQRYGIGRSLKSLYRSMLLLCALVLLASVIVPDMVWDISEMGVPRLRGDLIAPMGVVAPLAFILFFGIQRRTSLWMVPSFLTIATVLALSLMRTAYLAVCVFLILVVVLNPQICFRRALRMGCLVALPLAIGFGLWRVIQEVRNPESLYTLSDRVGLWTYMIDAVSQESPWFGMGYYAASRVLGPEYNPGLGYAHSIPVEVYVGGGLVAFAVYAVLFGILAWMAAQFLFHRQAGVFVHGALFCAVAQLSLTTGVLEGHPLGFTFWILAAHLPAVRQAIVRNEQLNASQARMFQSATPNYGHAHSLGP